MAIIEQLEVNLKAPSWIPAFAGMTFSLWMAHALGVKRVLEFWASYYLDAY